METITIASSPDANQVQGALTLAQDKNPDAYSKYVKLGKELGVAPELVDERLEWSKKQFEQKFDSVAIAERYPGLAKSLADKDIAAISWDDLANQMALEDYLTHGSSPEPGLMSKEARDLVISNLRKNGHDIQVVEQPSSVFAKALEFLRPSGTQPKFDWRSAYATPGMRQAAQEAPAPEPAPAVSAEQPKPAKTIELPTGQKGFLESFAENTARAQFIPFVASGVEFSELADMYGKLRRIESGEASDQDWISLLKMDAEIRRGTTFGGDVAKAVVQLPAFMGEMSATGGLYTAGKKAVRTLGMAGAKKILNKSAMQVGRSLALKSTIEASGWIAGSVLQGTVGSPHRVAAETLRRRLPQLKSMSENELGQLTAVLQEPNESFVTSLYKAMASNSIEMASEYSGGLLEKLGSKAIAATKLDAVKAMVVGRWFKLHPTSSWSQFQQRLKQVQFHGIIGEAGEEVVGDILTLLSQPVTGLETPDFNPREYLVAGVSAAFIPGAGLLRYGPEMWRASNKMAQQAQAQVDFFRDLGEVSANQKVRARVPGVLASLGNLASENGPVKSVFSPIDFWNAHWTQAQLDPREVAIDVLGSADAYDRAQESGSDLELPIGAYVEHIAPTEHNQAFSLNLRLGTPTAPTALEMAADIKAMGATMDHMISLSQTAETLGAESISLDEQQAALEKQIAEAQAALPQIQARLEQIRQQFPQTPVEQLAAELTGQANAPEMQALASEYESLAKRSDETSALQEKLNQISARKQEVAQQLSAISEEETRMQAAFPAQNKDVQELSNQLTSNLLSTGRYKRDEVARIHANMAARFMYILGLRSGMSLKQIAEKYPITIANELTNQRGEFQQSGNGGGYGMGGGAEGGQIQGAEQGAAVPGKFEPLSGAPKFKGATGPDPGLVAVAEKYAADNGIPFVRQAEYVKADPERGARIAEAYAEMPHAPQDPRVKEAYAELIRQTMAQYQALADAGYVFWFIDIDSQAGQDYAASPLNAMQDVRVNQSMGVFPTIGGFGSGATDINVEDNPLLADTGLKWPFGGASGELKPVLANDLFRAVHDAFGHGLEGAGFRADGEENAWQAHVRLFHGLAVGAITSETRGQNSWLNFGPHGEKNRTAKTEDTVFADQKTGLMPEWTWTEGRAADMPQEEILYQGENTTGSDIAPAFESLPSYKPSKAKATAVEVDGVTTLEISKDSQKNKPVQKAAWESGKDAALDRLDKALELLDKDPERIASGKGFVEYLNAAGVWGVVTPPPSMMHVLLNKPEMYVDLLNGGYHGARTEKGTQEAARAGLDGTVEMRNLLAGEAPHPWAVSLHHLWGILSRMLAPLDQEAMWLRLITHKPILDAIQSSIDGTFALTKKEWKARVKQARIETEATSRKRGNSATANANAFYAHLANWNGNWDKVAAIYASKSAAEMGRRFWKLNMGKVGIRNKVQRFIGLTFGVPGVILDRWKFVELWLPTMMQKSGITRPSEYFSYSGGLTPEDPLGVYGVLGGLENGNNGLSLALYEGIEKVMQKAIDASPLLQNHMGQHQNPGGMHWFGWNAIKNESVGHSSLDLTKQIIQIQKHGSSINAETIQQLILSGTFYTEGLAGAKSITRFAIENGIPVVTTRSRDADGQLGGLSGSQGGSADAQGSRAETAAQQEITLNQSVFPDIRLAQPAQGIAQGAISFSPAQRGEETRPFTISLLKKANASTFLHEMAHWYLEVVLDLTNAGMATGDLQTDIASVRQWLGMAGTDAPTTDQHEAFARGFEKYLMEGKAPAESVRGMFASMRAWLVRIYKDIDNPVLGAQISDDIRRVFDRMVATEQEIDATQSEIAVNPIFMERPAGMNDDEWERYRKMVEKASMQARERLQAQLMTELKDAETSERQAERERIFETVAAELNADPSQVALALLRHGTQPNGEPLSGNAVAFKLDRDSVAAIPGMTRETMRKLRHLGVYRVEDGVDAEAAANTLGFGSADELVQVLLNTSGYGLAVINETDKRLNAEHPSLMSSPEELRDQAEQQVRSSLRDRVIEMEMAALARMVRKDQQAVGRVIAGAALGPVARRILRADEAQALANTQLQDQRLIEEVVRIAGERTLRSLQIRAIRPSVYLAAAKRASKASSEASARGDYLKALGEKESELISQVMYRTAKEIQKTAEKQQKYLLRMLEDKSLARLGKAGEGYREQVEQLLERFQLKTTPLIRIEQRKRLADWITKQEADGFTVNIDDRVRDDAFRQDFRTMTASEFTALYDAVKQIDHLARLKNKLLAARDQREFDAIRADIISAMTAGRKAKPVEMGTKTDSEKRVDAFNGFFEAHRKTASLVREMDGFVDGGPLYWAFMDPINQAGNKEAEMNASATERLSKLFDVYSKEELRDMAKKKLVRGATMNFNFSHEDRLSIALNWGNEDNRTKLVDGYSKLTENDVLVILDTLTKKDWEFVQSVWDMIDSYWPMIEAKEKRVYGIAPEKVNSTPVNTKYGSFRGGYYPLKYDDAKSDSHESADVAKKMMRGAQGSASTRRGHAKERSEGVERPVRFGFGVITQHLNQVIHDVTHHEALITVNKILNDKQIAGTIEAYFGRGVLGQLKKSVESIAAGDLAAQNGVERFMAHVRAGAGITTMAFNLWTSLQQGFGVLNAVPKVGAGYILKGITKWVGSAKNMEDSLSWIYSRSSMMRMRGQTQNRELNEIRNKVNPNMRTGLMDSYFYLIQKGQMLADVPTWLGAYHKYMDQGLKEDRAIALADQAVIDTQGGGQIKDLAQIQRGGAFFKMWTTFYSYFNAAWNQNVEIVKSAELKDPVGFGKMLVDLLVLNSAPVAIQMLLMELLKGSENDDPWWKEFGKQQVSYYLGQLAVVREFGGLFDGRSYEGPAGARFFSSTYKLAKQVEQGELDRGFWSASASVAGTLFHFPSTQVQRTAEGIKALWEGKTRNPAVVILGPTKEERK